VDVARVTWPNFQILGPQLITFERIEQSASNLVQRWRTDPSCVWTIKCPPNGRSLGHVTQFRNFSSLITFERIELSISSLVHRPDLPCVRIIKRPESVRGRGHVTYFPNFGTPVTFEWIEQSASNLVEIENWPFLRVDHKKRPISGRGLGHVTKFSNFGTTLITFQRIELYLLLVWYNRKGSTPPACGP